MKYSFFDDVDKKFGKWDSKGSLIKYDKVGAKKYLAKRNAVLSAKVKQYMKKGLDKKTAFSKAVKNMGYKGQIDMTNKGWQNTYNLVAGGIKESSKIRDNNKQTLTKEEEDAQKIVRKKPDLVNPNWEGPLTPAESIAQDKLKEAEEKYEFKKQLPKLIENTLKKYWEHPNKLNDKIKNIANDPITKFGLKVLNHYDPDKIDLGNGKTFHITSRPKGKAIGEGYITKGDKGVSGITPAGMLLAAYDIGKAVYKRNEQAKENTEKFIGKVKDYTKNLLSPEVNKMFDDLINK